MDLSEEALISCMWHVRILIHTLNNKIYKLASIRRLRDSPYNNTQHDQEKNLLIYDIHRFISNKKKKIYVTKFV